MTSEILNIISSYLQYELLLDMKNGSLITEAEMTSNDLREGALGLLSLALQITSVVTFIIWFRRAYYNLGQFDKTKYS